MTAAIAARPIGTARLTLVPLTAAHADEMAAVLADPELYAFTGDAPPSRPELRARYERWAAGAPDPEVCWCNWAIRLRSAGRLTGTVQATISTSAEPVAEIAWVVGVRWQGQGIATEAARALVSWLGRQLGPDRGRPYPSGSPGIGRSCRRGRTGCHRGVRCRGDAVGAAVE